MPNARIPVPEFTDHMYAWHKQAWDGFYAHPTVRQWVWVVHRRGRKTTLGLNLLINEAASNPDSTFAYIGPTFREAKKTVWTDPMFLKRYLPESLLAKPFNETELHATFANGSVLFVGGADDPDRWRGGGYKGIIVDEFSYQRHGEELFEEILLPIITENNGWVVFMFTPKGKNHAYRYFKKAGETPGWGRIFLPADRSGVFTAEQLDRTRQNQKNIRTFEQEYLCKFHDVGGGVFGNIGQCINGTVQKPAAGGRYVIGCDLAKQNDFTVMVVINRDTRHVDNLVRFNHIDWSFQKERIAKLAAQYNNALIELDSTGLGDPILDDLRRMGCSVNGYTFTGKSKRQLMEKLAISIDERRVTFPRIEVLVSELEDFTIDEKGRYGAPHSQHDDCVIALALAIEGMGAEAFAPALQPEYAENERRRLSNMKRELALHSIGGAWA